jgi:hypothetical protein
MNVDRSTTRRGARLLAAVATLALLAAGCNARPTGQGGHGGGRPSHPRTTPPITAPPTTPPSSGGPKGGTYSGVSLPASAFQQETWGFIGCSNTHDTLWGYQHSQDAQLFWPFIRQYGIEGHTVDRWATTTDNSWALFDRMKQRYNGGQDPPVVWFQMCENIGVPGRGTFGPTTYQDVASALQLLHQHAPTSIVFISPLQSYDPVDLCNLMGPNGEAVGQLASLASQAVKNGLAYAGPGVDGIPNLGPITQERAYRDGCHPNGGPHGPGPGAQFLGAQLAAFFDHIPKK